MSKGKIGDAIGTGATTLLVLCAVVMTSLALRREWRHTPESPSGPTFELAPTWELYADSGHRIGPKNAKVVMVEFADFQCPACKALDERLRETRKHHPGDFAIIYRHFPLTKIHPVAMPAGIASECARSQGQFEEMHTVLFSVARDSLGVTPWRTLASKA